MLGIIKRSFQNSASGAVLNSMKTWNCLPHEVTEVVKYA